MPLGGVAAIGIAIVAGHNLLDPPLPRLVPAAQASRAPLLAVFGRVPLFYYLLHLPLIHAVALGVSYAR